MPEISRTFSLDPKTLAGLHQPRDTMVAETVAHLGDNVVLFGQANGPCTSYERRVVVDHAGARAHESIRYELEVPFWGWLIGPIFRRSLRRRAERTGQPWWAPPQRLDAHQVDTLARLVMLAICSGYIGTLLSQLMTFAGREFGAGPAAQGSAQAATRIGILVALVATTLSDRVGRRRILLFCLIGACIASSLTAAATDLITFAGIQILARGLTTGADVVRAVALAEDMPAGARAYAISLCAMGAGLGSGVVVWMLPLADLDPRLWRLIFALSLLFAPLAWRAGKGLKESRRFHEHRHDPDRPRLASHRSRLLMLAAAAMLTTVFAAPASQLQNEYLRGERGYSAGLITVFTLVTATPAGLAVFFGGRLAAVYGRRRIGAIGLVGASAGILASYVFGGALLWWGAIAGTLFGGLVVPTLVVYGPELFPTRLRGRANGVITLCAVIGSVVGLLTVGHLSETFGRFGPAMAIVATGPVAVALVVLTRFPETARRELEELNPTDA